VCRVHHSTDLGIEKCLIVGVFSDKFPPVL